MSASQGAASASLAPHSWCHWFSAILSANTELIHKLMLHVVSFPLHWLPRLYLTGHYNVVHQTDWNMKLFLYKLLDLEQRSVIKFLTKEVKKPKEIIKCTVAVYGESAPSYYKVDCYSKQFKWGRESIEDDPHPGRPVDATSEEMCQKLESLILADRRMKVSRLAEETGISAGAVRTIIHETWTCPKSVQVGSQEYWVLFRRTLVASAVKRNCSCPLRIRNIFFNVSWQETRLATSQWTWVQNGIHAVEAQVFPRL